MGQSRTELRRGDLAVRTLALMYLALMVVLPIASLAAMSMSKGIGSFWSYVSRPEAVAAMVLTVEMSLIATVITVIAGFGIAWTLKRKEFFGKKLGLKLLDVITQYSKEHNQSGIWLFTWIGNERAIDFYKKAGFEIIGSHEFKVSETHYNPNHQMHLRY